MYFREALCQGVYLIFHDKRKCKSRYSYLNFFYLPLEAFFCSAFFNTGKKPARSGYDR